MEQRQDGADAVLVAGSRLIIERRKSTVGSNPTCFTTSSLTVSSVTVKVNFLAERKFMPANLKSEKSFLLFVKLGLLKSKSQERSQMLRPGRCTKQ